MKFIKRHRKLLNILIKVAILGLLFLSIYKQVFKYPDFDVIKQAYFKTLREGNMVILGIVFLMMFLNWGLEAFKWKLIIDKLTGVSFLKSFRAVMGGVAFSVFTPNRVGEFAGRVIFLKETKRIKAVVFTLVGSYSQILITISMGLLGMTIFLEKYTDINGYMLFAVSSASILLVAVLLLIYFNIDIVNIWFTRWAFMKKVLKYTRSLNYFRYTSLSTYIGISLLRFIVFSVQYLLLLEFLNIPLPVFEGLMMISLIFLVQMLLPSMALVDLGIRGNVAFIFITYMLPVMELNQMRLVEISIWSAAFGLWAINIIIPSILGGFFILRLNILNK